MAALTLVTPPASLAALIYDSVLTQLSADVETGESPTPDVPDAQYILALTEAAVMLLDGPSGKLGRCLLSQTWRQTVDHCWPPVIGLTLPPIQSVDAVKYIDGDGVQRTLAPSAYRVTGAGSWLTEIAPAYGQTWPTVRWQAETIEVEFTSGYGTGADDVPAPILQAIRLLVGHLYQNREAVNVGNITGEIPFGVRSLLAPLKVFRGCGA